MSNLDLALALAVSPLGVFAALGFGMLALTAYLERIPMRNDPARPTYLRTVSPPDDGPPPPHWARLTVWALCAVFSVSVWVAVIALARRVAS